MRREHNALAKTANLSATNYALHARALAGGKDGYWNEGTEMFARAFESYVQDKIEGSGRRNSYLVDGTNVLYESGPLLPTGEVAQQYPQGEERKRINEAFDAFFAELRTGQHLSKALAAAELRLRGGPG